MKFLPYILKHLRRNWVRTLSTVLGMALCVFLIAVLQTVLVAMDASVRGASPDRLATRHAVSLVFNMPYAYRSRISAVPGVRRVSPTNFFGGLPGSGGSADFANFFANFAVEADTYFAMYPEYNLPRDQWDAFRADRRGAVIGRALSRKFGWNLGDTFQLESFIPPYRVGRPFEFVVRAIYDADLVRYPATNEMQMFFHFDYLYESTRRRAGVGTFMVQIDDPARTAEIARLIDEAFENSDVQTKTETEGAFIQSFNELAGNLVLLLNAIGLAVGFTVLLVTANTMSMAVRERRTEIAVLKTLGFSSARVMGLIIGEAMVIAAAAGALGIGLANGLVSNLADIPFLGAAVSQFPSLNVSPRLALGMFAVSLALGTAAGAVPAWTAYRAKIVDTLRAA
ncbi:MAG: FtsX-like permease family protein [Acidobacteriota bacterium]